MSPFPKAHRSNYTVFLLCQLGWANWISLKDKQWCVVADFVFNSMLSDAWTARLIWLVETMFSFVYSLTSQNRTAVCSVATSLQLHCLWQSYKDNRSFVYVLTITVLLCTTATATVTAVIQIGFAVQRQQRNLVLYLIILYLDLSLVVTCELRVAECILNYVPVALCVALIFCDVESQWGVNYIARQIVAG